TLPTLLKCTFCGMFNYIQDKCYCFLKVQKEAIDSVYTNHGKGKKVAKVAQEVAENKENVIEYARNASALSSVDPTMLQSNADFFWLADTGATSHMTLHCQWMQNHCPLCISICLASYHIIYSKGVGTVVFNPVI
ncbi:hypothetical protein BDN70DRAFT_763661, partial [Pholiota conissans]